MKIHWHTYKRVAVKDQNLPDYYDQTKVTVILYECIYCYKTKQEMIEGHWAEELKGQL